METINNKNININILDQLTLYNSDELDVQLIKYKHLLNEQNKLNDALKNQNVEDNISFINNFISQNHNQISFQLDEIKKITSQLKKICLENEEIENREDEYKNLIKSPECINIANKLSEIKKLKEDINSFLDIRGIYIGH